MALAYSPELEAKVRAAINDGSDKAIGSIHFEIFGKTVKKNCGGCYNEAISKLIKWTKTKYVANCKYRINAKYNGTVFSVNVGGTIHRVTNDNISVATAEMIMSNPKIKSDVIELNPDWNGIEVKKNILKDSPSPMPILSILPEALPVTEILKENVSAKESVIQESKPLMAEPKKRGRPSKLKEVAEL